MGKALGSGHFATVRLGRRVSDGQLAAIKVIELDAVGDEIDEIQGEIAVLSNANCPQLISYVGSYVVGTQLWIAMEYLSGGSLWQLLAAEWARLRNLLRPHLGNAGRAVRVPTRQLHRRDHRPNADHARST